MDNMPSSIAVKNCFDLADIKQRRNWVEINTGVKISYIYQDENTGSAAAFILYEPNTQVDCHQHLGYEHVLVLEGEQSDEHYVYGAGCLAIQRPQSRHSLTSKTGCLVLAIWTAPLNFDLD